MGCGGVGELRGGGGGEEEGEVGGGRGGQFEGEGVYDVIIQGKGKGTYFRRMGGGKCEEAWEASSRGKRMKPFVRFSSGGAYESRAVMHF